MESLENTESVALHVERHDGAFSFDDPAVPRDWTVEQLTENALSRLRYPSSDVTSGKPLRYSMLADGAELPREAKVGEALPKAGAKVRVVRDYVNAA